MVWCVSSTILILASNNVRATIGKRAALPEWVQACGKEAYLIFTAAVSCDHCKEGKLHTNPECVKEPISSY